MIAHADLPCPSCGGPNERLGVVQPDGDLLVSCPDCEIQWTVRG